MFKDVFTIVMFGHHCVFGRSQALELPSNTHGKHSHEQRATGMRKCYYEASRVEHLEENILL